MRVAVAALLLVGVAANAALFAWQLRSPPKTTMSESTASAVLMRTSGGLLEVSTITTKERFDSTTTHTILGVPLLQLAALVEPDIPG